jgi:hypothetical protein
MLQEKQMLQSRNLPLLTTISVFLTSLVGMWHTFFGYASLFFWHAGACGIPSLGMHLLFLFA